MFNFSTFLRLYYWYFCFRLIVIHACFCRYAFKHIEEHSKITVNCIVEGMAMTSETIIFLVSIFVPNLVTFSQDLNLKCDF